MSELRVQELRFTFDPLKYAVERERDFENFIYIQPFIIYTQIESVSSD